MNEIAQKPLDYPRYLKLMARYVGGTITLGTIGIGVFTNAPFFPHTVEGWFWFGMMFLAASEIRK